MTMSGTMLSKQPTAMFAALPRHGFQRKGRVWWKNGPETNVVFELHKSQYSNMFYCNLGVWLNALGQLTQVAPHRCHFNARLDNARVLEALDFDTAMTDVERRAVIAQFETEILLPATRACETVRGTARFLRDGTVDGSLVGVLVLPEARPLLLEGSP
jgi:hypothetical protein